MGDLVQIKNPRTNLYVLVDRKKGEIVEHKEAPGPYEEVPVAKMRTIKEPEKEPDNFTREEAGDAVRAVAQKRKRGAMPKTRLQKSEVNLEATLATAVITPEDGRTTVRLNVGRGYGANEQRLVNYPLTPEDAHALGRALTEHAEACGYNADTGETHPVTD